MADKSQSDLKPLAEKEFADSLQDYLDNRMTREQCLEFEKRANLTPKHREELAAAKQLSSQLRSFGREILDEPVPERLHALLRAFKAERGPYDN